MPRTLDDVRRLVAADHGLATLVSHRGDGTAHATLINAGVIRHPVTGQDVVALVAIGSSRKLVHLRARPRATISWRSGWDWVTVEGSTELAGPDDVLPGLEPDRVPALLREVFTGAGGTHDDWPTYDRVMAEEGRCAILITPARVYGNA